MRRLMMMIVLICSTAYAGKHEEFLTSAQKKIVLRKLNETPLGTYYFFNDLECCQADERCTVGYAVRGKNENLEASDFACDVDAKTYRFIIGKDERIKTKFYNQLLACIDESVDSESID